MKKELRSQEKWSGRFNNLVFEDIEYDELTIRNSRFTDCRFDHVDVKHSNIGFQAKYEHCVFSNCNFWGANSHFGGPAEFIHCRFEECTIQGIYILQDVTFTNCVFSGKLADAIMFGREFRREAGTVRFDRCDLSSLLLENVNIKGTGIFVQTRLPKQGVRKFNNPTDDLLEHAVKVISRYPDDIARPCSILFKRDLRGGQDPVVFDEIMLAKVLETAETRDLFEEIVTGFEMT
jgi:hypothetical protein